MTIEPIFVALFEGAGITSYPMKIPANGSYPCVVYQLISDTSIRSHQAGNQLTRRRYQFACWAKTYGETIDTVEQVKDLLDLNTTDFEVSWKEGEIDLADTETSLYRRIVDIFILYK